MKNIIQTQVIAAGFLALVACCASPATTEALRGRPCLEPAIEGVTAVSNGAREWGMGLDFLEEATGETTLKNNLDEFIALNYGKLNNDEAELYLLLRAIHCYLEQGSAGEGVARSIAEAVVNRYGGTLGASSNQVFDTIQWRQIEEAPFSQPLLAELERWEIRR